MTFNNAYQGRRVLVTGHTGFKGSWLCAWLLELGAEVTGFSLNVPTQPANFEIIGLDRRLNHVTGDIRDGQAVAGVFDAARPEVVFHLAAQSVVRRSYEEPVYTFETNALGTLNVLEAIRCTMGCQAGVIITSDKCYRNLEWPWGYRETDILGGDDPYSASKGCAELIVHSYVQSFFRDRTRVSSTRAGNVIGGGDWALDRIVPDAVRAWSEGRSVMSRSPHATRPWQHVLEPLGGYLWLGAKLLEKNDLVAGEAFNFGPDPRINQTVGQLLSALAVHWHGAEWEAMEQGHGAKKESNLLKLCCDKALHLLDWYATLTIQETVALTADWYRAYYQDPSGDMIAYTKGQIEEYTRKAQERGLAWSR